MLKIKASQIKKRFETPTPIEVLKGIDLEITGGESIAIMGKSGEGKSTLLHILGTLEKPTSGSLEICGRDCAQTSLPLLRNKEIGFIFQNYNLLEDYTALENLLMPAKIGRMTTSIGSQAHTRALWLLEKVELKERSAFPAKLLSGGEKQRVAIARALMNDPSILLADEPSGNLDQIHSEEIHTLLLGLCREFEKTLLIVTHDQELAALCDRTLHLKEGYLFSN